VRTSEWKARRRGAAMGNKGLLKKQGTKKGKALTGEGATNGDAQAGQEEDGEGEDGEAVEENAGAEDALEGVFCCHDFDALLVFSEHGFVYMLQALDVPLAKKMTAPGTELKEFLPELEGHRIAALVTVPHGSLRDQTNEFVVLVSKNGLAKKVSLDRYRGLRPGRGVPAMKLDADDELRWAHKASQNAALVVATAQGFVLRVSLGEDWSLSTAKGPGRCVMKTRPGSGDWIASCSVSDLTPEEQAKAAAKVAKAKERRAAAAAAAAASGDLAEVNPKGEDDEEGEVEEEQEQEAAAEESEAEEADEAEAGDTKGDVEMTGEGEVAKTHEQGQCVLLITECGMGLRTPLSCKRISLGRKGGKGRKVIKLMDSGKNPDVVVSACVVSGHGEVKQPVKPPAAWQMYMKEASPSESQVALPSEELEAAEAEGAGTSGFAKIHEIKDKFNKLPEEVQLPFLERAEELKQKYDEEFDAYRRQELEEILLGTTLGLVSRITVGSVPITTRVNRGRTIAKMKNGNRICAVSLLSSIDDDPEETAAASTAPRPATAAPRIQRRAAAVRAALARRREGQGPPIQNSILKPKLRLLGSPRKNFIVTTIDLAEWEKRFSMASSKFAGR
jgi:DNA gyrase/topoisomerase IV subunit A